MSLGVNEAVEDAVLRCLGDYERATAIEVAVWIEGRRAKGEELRSVGEVAEAMLRMEEQGILRFIDGMYEVTTE